MSTKGSCEPGWAVVTGASSGIGEAVAKRLAREGWGAVLVSEQPDELERVAAEIAAAGGRAMPLECDLLKPEQLQALAASAERAVGPVDLLVNNAGIGLHKSLLESSDAEFQRVFQVNFFATVTLTRSFLPSMIARGQGHILNVSSASARRSLSKMSCYGASKAAVHAFTQSLRLELAGTGVTATEVLPISVSTPFFERAGYRPKGLVQTPESVAELVFQAVRTRPAELCTSRLTALGFVVDALCPNLVARGLAWVEARRRNRE